MKLNNNISAYHLHSLWGLGFRPMFLVGSMAALALMLIWLRYLLQGYSPLSEVDPILWHAHEMVFGVGGAIIAGFLLTASANWAGKKGVSGQPLIVLTSFWIAARILPLMVVSAWIMLLAELGFWFYLSWLLRPTLQGHNRIFWLLLGLLLGTDVLSSLELFGFIDKSALGLSLNSIQWAIAVIICMIVLIAGRVLPFFTERALPGVQIARHPSLDQLALGITLAFAMAQMLLPHSGWTAALAFLAGCIHLFRWQNWNPWQSRKVPILWILYLGYFWLILGFFLHSLAALAWIPRSIATHAWTAGAMGTFIYGMISRVSLGHTGRPIQASWPICVGYLLVTLAAVVRLFPGLWPAHHKFFVITAAVLWSLAFGILVAVYLPIWLQPRVDGKPG